jgi:hypothetical protein
MDDLDGLQLIHTPGRCAGQVAFLWPREGGVLFVGDAAANTLGLRLSISYEDLALGKRMPGQACGTSLLGSALRPRENDRKRGCGEVRAEVGNSLEHLRSTSSSKNKRLTNDTRLALPR